MELYLVSVCLLITNNHNLYAYCPLLNNGKFVLLVSAASSLPITHFI